MSTFDVGLFFFSLITHIDSRSVVVAALLILYIFFPPGFPQGRRTK